MMEFAMTSSKHQVRRASLTASLVAAAALGGCATNPVSGRSELSLISQSQEIQMGKQASAGDLQSVGEANNPAAQDLVRIPVEKRKAAMAERFTVTMDGDELRFVWDDAGYGVKVKAK